MEGSKSSRAKNVSSVTSKIFQCASNDLKLNLNKRSMDLGTLLDDSTNTCKFVELFLDAKEVHWIGHLEKYKVNAIRFIVLHVPIQLQTETNLFRSMPSCFRVTRHFETNEMNES